MRVKLFLSICILSLIAYTLFLFLHSPKLDPLSAKTTALSKEAVTTLSTQEIQIDVIQRTAEADPIQAIALLKQFIESEPTFMNQCHEMAHEIGHISYENFGEQAFSFKDPFCGGGYLHGLLEEATIFDESMSLTEIVHTVCSGDIEESCLHGLGHAIYKSTQDISDSVKYCDKVRTNNKDCYDGIYMELFDREDSAGVSVVDATEICNAASERTRLSCLFYLPRVLKNAEPETATTFCANFFDPDARATCAQGSGVMFMKYATLFEIEAVTKTCALYTEESLKQACTTGANAYYTYGNVTNTEW